MKDALFIVFLLLLACWLLGAIRRLHFHPLSRYPGTKLGVAFPTLRKLYRNFKHRGQFIFEIEQLHKRYGPVVRIGYRDLHVNDPEIFLEVTKIGSRFRKDAKFYDRISFRSTSLGFLDPYEHRTRHTILSKAAFSTAKVKSLAPLVEAKVEKLMERFARESGDGLPVNIHKAAKALSMDIISDLALGQSFDCLDHPTYKNLFLEKLHAIFQEMNWIQKILFTVAKVSLSSPPWMFRFIHPPTMVMMKNLAKPIIQDYCDHSQASKHLETGKPAVIIDALTNVSNAPDCKPISFDNLCEEIVTLLTAGGDTVSSALIWGIYRICRENHVYSVLKKEISAAFPPHSRITYDTAKDLPYLVSWIKWGCTLLC